MKVSQQLFESILEEQLHKNIDSLLVTEPVSSQMLDTVRHYARIAVIETLRSGVAGHMSREQAHWMASLVDITVDGSRMSFEASRLYTELYPPRPPRSNSRIFIPIARQPGVSTRREPNLPEGYHPPRPRPSNRFVFPTAVTEEERERILGSVPDGTVVRMRVSEGVAHSALTVGTVLYMNVDGSVTPYAAPSPSGQPRMRIGCVHSLDLIPGTDRPSDLVPVLLSRTFEYVPVEGVTPTVSLSHPPANPTYEQILGLEETVSNERLRGQSSERVMIDDAGWGSSPLAEIVQPLAQMNEMQRAQAAYQQQLMGAFAIPPEMLRAQGGVSGAESQMRIERALAALDAGHVSRGYVESTMGIRVEGELSSGESQELQMQSIQEPRRKIEP